MTEDRKDWMFKLSLMKWYKIELHQKTGIFSVLVDGKYLWSVQSGNTRFENVQWYQSDRWYPSAVSEGDISKDEIKLKHIIVQNEEGQLHFLGL